MGVYQKVNGYREVINKMTLEGKLDYRYKMVKFALSHNKSIAAREFKTSRYVVRKWVTRYEEAGLRGLMEHSKQPHYSPNKCSAGFERKVIQLRLRTKHKYGANRLIERFSLKHSKNCVQRIINQNGVKRKPKTKRQKRNELWSVKKLMGVFEKIQVDVKILTDIANYYPSYVRNKLPKYEFSARDVKTGASFVCFAYKNNSANAATFIAYLGAHLKHHGFDVKEITFQMDNGAEFFACGQKKIGKTPVEALIEDNIGAKIGRIPPASPTFNSDVETFHRLVENEFYCVEDIQDNEDLVRKMYTYLLDFNFLRKNSYKDNKTPYTLAKEEFSDFNTQLFSMIPIILDDNQHLYYQNIPNRHSHSISRLTADGPRSTSVSPFQPIDMDPSLYGWGWDIHGDSVFCIDSIPRGGKYLPGIDSYLKLFLFKNLILWE